MSVKVKYKGEEILSLNTDGEEALATQGQYCEADIIIENTQDGDVGGDYDIESVDDGEGGQILNITDAEGGGGGGWDIQGATVTEITIGANNVQLGDELFNYFGGTVAPIVYVLMDNLTVDNQCVICPMFGGQFVRWRNGTLTYPQFRNNYDSRLVEGSKYLKIDFG